MARVCSLPALCMLIAVSMPRGAVAASSVWLCGLSVDLTRLVCVHDADSTAQEEQTGAAPIAVVNGTRFPLDPRGQWTVDLWSPATERETVLQLARATICYRNPSCEVVLNMPGPDLSAALPVTRGRTRR